MPPGPERNRCLSSVRLADALNICSFESAAHRGSILFRCEGTYLCGETLRPTININTRWRCDIGRRAAERVLTKGLEGRLAKQCWLLLLQPAKNREYLSFAAV